MISGVNFQPAETLLMTFGAIARELLGDRARPALGEP